MLQWLKRVLTRNLLLKFAALVCAVVLWVYVDSTVMAERTIVVPINWATGRSYEFQWRDGTPWGESPPKAAVRVRGPRSRVAILDPDTVWVGVNYVGAGAGDKVVPLREEDVVFDCSAGDRLEVLAVSPRNLTARIVRTDTPRGEAVRSP